MDRAFISEWVKLRRTGMAVAIAAIVGFAVLTIVLTFTKAESSSGGPQEMFGASLGVTQLSAADGFARSFARGGTFIGVVALGIVAMNVAAEFSEGTLRNLLVRQPRRMALFGGKLLALASFLAVAVALAYVIALLVALAVAPRYGVSTAAWFSSSGWRELLAGSGNALAAALGWGVLGAVLAVGLRSPAPALAVGVAYALPLENLLVAAWRDGDRWLPGQLLLVLASGGTASVSYERAAVMVAAYAAIAVAMLLGLIDRRDVTA